MSVTAIIPTLVSTAFRRLGHRTLLDWTLEKIPEIRGIDETVCLVGPGNPMQVRSQIYEVSSAVTDGNLTAIADYLETVPRDQSRIFLELDVRLPFVSAVKLEECVVSVVENEKTRAVVARPVTMLPATPKDPTILARDAISQSGWIPRLSCGARKLKHDYLKMVCISSPEALYIGDDTTMEMAEAMLLSGLV